MPLSPLWVSVSTLALTTSAHSIPPHEGFAKSINGLWCRSFTYIPSPHSPKNGTLIRTSFHLSKVCFCLSTTHVHFTHIFLRHYGLLPLLYSSVSSTSQSISSTTSSSCSTALFTALVTHSRAFISLLPNYLTFSSGPVVRSLAAEMHPFCNIWCPSPSIHIQCTKLVGCKFTHFLMLTLAHATRHPQTFF